MNKYKKAVMENVTFTTLKGEISLQDLFNLPITGEVSLNTIGRALNVRIEAEAKDIVKTSSMQIANAKFKLSIITDVIDTKFKLADKAKLSAEQRLRRQELTKALEVKRVDNLSKMSEEDILKELDSMK